jgi:hypothetical protein
LFSSIEGFLVFIGVGRFCAPDIAGVETMASAAELCDERPARAVGRALRRLSDLPESSRFNGSAA